MVAVLFSSLQFLSFLMSLGFSSPYTRYTTSRLTGARSGRSLQDRVPPRGHIQSRWTWEGPDPHRPTRALTQTPGPQPGQDPDWGGTRPSWPIYPQVQQVRQEVLGPSLGGTRWIWEVPQLGDQTSGSLDLPLEGRCGSLHDR